MRVSLSWLEDYVTVDVPVAELVERLNLSGTKVEAVHEPADELDGVVVAEVAGVRPHPSADGLVLVEARLPEGTQPVVVGVRNFSVGDRVPLATVGARLGELRIGEREIRGQLSRGMLCSAAELGVSKDHSGILVLAPDAPLGESVVPLLGLDDTIIELEITPNRPDCMGMIGIAREVAALLGNELALPAAEPVVARGVPDAVAVEIADLAGCPRYVARVIDAVAPGPSPAWMARRLLAAGIRPISSVVDVTNYVMLETGQPLHAFDAHKLDGGRIVVRRAEASERIVTLDGVERALRPEDLVIADRSRPVAIAGVMGGADTEVTEETTTVVLESAHFTAPSVALTARRHLLRTEASARFERGTDPNVAAYASRRAAGLISEVAGGKVAEEQVDAYPQPIGPRRLRLRPARTSRLLGIDIPAAEQAALLGSIGLAARPEGHDLLVEVPTFRPDVGREADLIEEVGRLAGYGRLPARVPAGTAGGLERREAVERRLRLLLADLGLREAWTPSFGSPDELDRLALAPDHPARAQVELANPTSEEAPALRSTLLPGLLRSAAHNATRGAVDGALFEIAPVYLPSQQLAHERRTLGAVFWGARRPKTWLQEEVAWDFFGVKGILDAVVARLGLGPLSFAPSGEMPWHPTRGATVSLDGRALGGLGELHPEVCSRFGVPEGAPALELDLEGALSALPGRPQAADPPRYPAVLLDLAIVVDEAVTAAETVAAVRRSGGSELASLSLFDVYRGEQVPAGRKSLAFALELRSPERTLTDEDAEAIRDRILSTLQRELGAELRR